MAHRIYTVSILVPPHDWAEPQKNDIDHCFFLELLETESPRLPNESITARSAGVKILSVNTVSYASSEISSADGVSDLTKHNMSGRKSYRTVDDSIPRDHLGSTVVT